MSEKNRFGLDRNIPDGVAREVRQRCGFGCVVCGSAFYQYEHLDPEFVDAQKHDPQFIVLLCGSCHGRVTSGMLSKETVKRHAENPKCKQLGFSFGAFDIGPDAPEVAIGDFSGYVSGSLVEIDGEKIFSVSAPEAPGGPFQIDAMLRDRDGNCILMIEKNHWKTPLTNWDVEVVGQHITIRRKLRDIVLILRSEPPRRLVAEHLDLRHNGTRVEVEEGEPIRVVTADGVSLSAQGVRMKSHTGIKVSKNCVQVGVGAELFMYSNLHIQHVGEGNVVTIGGSPLVNQPGGGEHLHRTFPRGVQRAQKVGRNDPCPCGTGKKFKKCCGSGQTTRSLSPTAHPNT